MVGNPKWFKRRKYGGWGITPSTWQGWLYLGIVLLPFIVFQAFPLLNDKNRQVFTIIWLAFLGLDILHIMVNLDKDEREKAHEAVAERNAAWAMIGTLVVAALYQTITSSVKGSFSIDPFILIVLFAGAFAKTLTNYILRNK